MKTLDELNEELDEARLYLRKSRSLLEDALEEEREAASTANYLQGEVERQEDDILRLEGLIDDMVEVDDE